MAKEDRRRWDEKWGTVAPAFGFRPHGLLAEYADKLPRGKALDLACGLGQNALWLAGQGWQVTGIDISPVALAEAQSEAQRRGLSIELVVADLDTYPLPQAAFDVITVFRFLDRRLFGAIEGALRPGGWLIYETFNRRRLAARPDSRSGFMLEIGELERAFDGLEMVASGDEGETSYFVGRLVLPGEEKSV